jgi:two-component system sensor histidine kinase/response regulator
MSGLVRHILKGIGRLLGSGSREAADQTTISSHPGFGYERQLLRTLVDHVPDCMYAKDTESRFLIANQAVANIMGVRDPQDLIGKTDFDFYPPELANQYRRDEISILESGQAIINREEKASISADLRWLLTTKVPLLDDLGKVVGLVGIGRDITKRKETERLLVEAKEAAESASRAKSEFLANMSHEIRTPMNGVLGMTDLALDTELLPEQREYLTTVKSCAESLLTVINDVLDFSKIEAGKLDLDSVEFCLRETLEDTIRALSPRAFQKGLELITDVGPLVPEVVVGDPLRLRQIVVNLVGNAIKFTAEGEVKLMVRVEERGEGTVNLRFTVADTGMGIPLEKQRLIFEAFAQADASTTRKFGGTGLGLAISARLTELMGGRIWVESEPGRGSRFHVALRLGVAANQRAAAAPMPELEALRILIVDDNASNRTFLHDLLQRWRMRPLVAEGAQDALACLARAQAAGDPVRLVLTDYEMPEVDGLELARRIRQDPVLADVPILMLSSAPQKGDSAACRELRIGSYLVKPIRQSELRKAIGNTLRPGDARRQAAPAEDKKRPPERALSVLVAEDNAVNQRVAVRLLEKEGHRVTLANNGLEALEALERAAFDVVLMDVQMPELDGFEATRRLREREQPQARRVPVIALTAHVMKGDRELCLAAGMDAYVSKPLQRRELLDTIERVTAITH